VRTYGALPAELGHYDIDCREFMFYQYLPVKLAGVTEVVMERRLDCFRLILGAICCDYVGFRGLNAFVDSYVYLTAKHMVTAPGAPMNRPGWHSDGFLTSDINYIWSDCFPTVFNCSSFSLTLDDEISLDEMSAQAAPYADCCYGDGTLLRLDQFCVHRVADIPAPLVRTFLKVSFSLDRYDLIGNSHNFELNYDWPMRERKLTRNVPQPVGKS